MDLQALAGYVLAIAGELNVKAKQVESTMALLEDGATVPFISRYRKEATGSLDEVQVAAIRDRLAQMRELDKRRASILATIEEQGKLTPDLKKKIEAAATMTVLEDLYLPYKPKRRTRGTIAKEKGLEPFAELIIQQGDFDLNAEATKYINAEKEVVSADDAIKGARDIIAEQISEDSQAREQIRQLYWDQGIFATKVATGKEEEGIKYKDYYDWSEPVKTAPSHRVLAMRRGAKEKFLSLRVNVPEEDANAILEKLFVKAGNDAAIQVKLAAIDSFKRLISLSMETEIRLDTKKEADLTAIKVFADNLRQLLMASPLGEKNVLALDPGFRTGCKLVCLNAQGKLVYNDTIYPHTGGNGAVQAGVIVKECVKKYNIEAIAVGNGTASRETEDFLRKLELGPAVAIVMVNESGASIYSASEVARDEFPDYDLTVRGAVSIGRRLMDPLAELVKIDAKSIGVGQYQHDVDQKQLKVSLDDVVESCVNNVGVEVNTASKQLLTYVAGVGANVAGKLVAFRDANGAFLSREQLSKVPGMGPKTFEQCAGFLRIRNGQNPLDASAVHPETYPIVENMAKDLGCAVKDLVADPSLVAKIELSKYVSDTIGLPTLSDIKAELAKPGRDPREKFEAFSFAEGINEMSDLTVGMELLGIVTNITAFGAFVDVGVHQDGLVHISKMANHFISDPSEVVKVAQKVKVTVTEIDIARKRIALSMVGDSKEASGTSGVSREPRKPQNNNKQNNRKPRDNKSTGGGAFGSSLNINFG
ncbi:MAG: RNA-binding transcriptional accessory protein [Phycisphaerae bacterium]|nr:RNA-binding transcriptional accessory protein [Phycisphaerae bacterium]